MPIVMFLDASLKLGLWELLWPARKEEVPPANCFEAQALLLHPCITKVGTLGLTCWCPGSASRGFVEKTLSKVAGNEVVVG